MAQVKEMLRGLNHMSKTERMAASNGWVNTENVIKEYSSDMQELSLSHSNFIKELNNTLMDTMKLMRGMKVATTVISGNANSTSSQTLTGAITVDGYTGMDTGTKTVTTAGTRVQVSASSVPCKCVIVSADLGNTNPIVVGGANVVAASGSQQGIVLIPANGPVTLNINNLNKIYVDAITNGDKLSYAYFV